MSGLLSGCNKSRIKRAQLSLAISAALLGASPLFVLAQNDSGVIEGKEVERETLEVINVTATRDVTNLMKTPLAVTALDPETLVRENVKSLSDLTGMMPNIEFGLSAADSGVQIGIRGVTSTNFTEIGDPAVGVHIDGIYSPRPQGSLALMFDLEQVEVLRGAQGTLFGRNSTAGVVNVIPAKPEFGENYGWSNLQLGNYNAKQLRSVYNFGVSDTFAFRAALMVDKRDGYIDQERDLTDRGIKTSDGSFTPDGLPDVDQRLNKEIGPEDYYTNSDQWGMRLTGLWAIADNHSLTLGYEHYQNSSAGEVGMKDCEAVEGTRFSCGDKGQWYALVNVPGMIDMSIDTVRLKYGWQVNDHTNLEYRLGYAVQQRAQNHDDDGGLHPLEEDVGIMQPWGNWGMQHVVDRATYTLDSKFRSYVNELQLKQRYDSFNYVAGLFWLKEKNAITFAQDNLVGAEFGLPVGQFYEQPDRQIDSKAIFTQANFLLTDKLTATAGYRYSQDERSDNAGATYGGWTAGTWYYNGAYTPGALGVTAPHNGTDLTFDMGPFAGKEAYQGMTVNTYKNDWSASTWRLGLQYDIDERRMLFTSVATGYRPGGFGDRFDTCGGRPCADPELTDSEERFSYLDYKPERTKNFEVGYKGNHFDQRLNFSAVYFLTKYTDMHFTDMHAVGMNIPAQACPDWNPACEIVNAWKTENIGEADIQGLELEFTVIPWSGGRLSGFAAWLDSEITSYKTYNDNWFCGYRAEFGAEACAPVYLGDDPEIKGRAIYDVTGHSLPRTPKYSVGVNLSHDFEMDGYVITPWLGLSWKDKQYFTPRNLDNKVIGDYQDAYTNVNASVKFAPTDSNWYVELYGTNLSDNIVKNWMGQGATGGYTFNSFNPPRMYGARLNVSY